ncbi:MAG: carboxypeptidase regulatory-like domain-containing protein [Planctomycetia bacterium]|nr:carboxypeptidase regulatory-like domain-containing protein [Planctomycetia bacterium]
MTGRVWRDGRPTAATVELRRVGDVRPESLRTGGDPLDRRAWVRAMGADGPALRAVATDARGGFEVGGLVPGVYEARVTIGGSTQAQPVVIGRDGERVAARLEWADGTETLEVIVRGADGAPAAATVGLAPGEGWAWTRGPLARRTDAAGRVRFEGVPAGPLAVVAAVDGEAGVREAYVVVPRVPTVELEPAAARKERGVVTGRVTRGGVGTPVANVWVYATAAREDASLPTYPSRSAPTNAEGRFRIEGLGVGWVTVFVQGDGFLSVGLERVRDDADDPLARRTDAAGVLEVALEVVEAAPVVGRVVDPAGRPIVGARVELDAFGVVGRTRTGLHPPEQGVLNAPVETVSDAEGRFALSAPIPGHGYVVRARAPGFASGASGAVRAGDGVDVIVTLTPAGGARFAEILVVAAGSRRPVAGARVVVWRETGPGAREGVGQGTTGRDGVAWVGPFASLEGLTATSDAAPGESFPFARAAEPVPLADGVTVVERAGPSAVLTARIEGPDGLEPGSLVVAVFGPGIEGGMEQRGGVDATGLTEVRVPSDGTYRVVVRGTAAGVTVAGEAEGVTGAASPLRVVLVPVR